MKCVFRNFQFHSVIFQCRKIFFAERTSHDLFISKTIITFFMYFPAIFRSIDSFHLNWILMTSLNSCQCDAILEDVQIKFWMNIFSAHFGWMRSNSAVFKHYWVLTIIDNWLRRSRVFEFYNEFLRSNSRKTGAKFD
jgi:hypothetical protein